MYIVMEIQVFENNTTSTPCYAFENKLAAEQKYHAILSDASVSTLPRHGAVMLTSEGYYIKSESYEHVTETEEN